MGKLIARRIIQVLLTPMVPLLAVGYWSGSDKTYLESIKEVWKL